MSIERIQAIKVLTERLTALGFIPKGQAQDGDNPDMVERGLRIASLGIELAQLEAPPPAPKVELPALAAAPRKKKGLATSPIAKASRRMDGA
jgi:hypothetical protein